MNRLYLKISSLSLLIFVSFFWYYFISTLIIKKQLPGDILKYPQPERVGRTCRSLLKEDVISKEDEVIHLVVVACKSSVEEKRSAEELSVMIKSVILFTEHKVHIHIYTSDLADEICSEINSWPSLALEKIIITFGDVSYPISQNKREELREWWAPCASFRLFLPIILDLDAVIYVDTDVVFLSPIHELWKHFQLFKVNQVLGMAKRVGWNFKVPETSYQYIKLAEREMIQVNSGVMLMNLTKMRTNIFRSPQNSKAEKKSWNEQLFLPLYEKYNFDKNFNDQQLINIILHYNPELLYLLPCKYNYHHKFCYDKVPERSCQSADQEGVLVAHGSANTFHNNYAPAFRSIFDALNQVSFGNEPLQQLLDRLQMVLNDPKIENHSHCGGRSEIFLKNLRRQVEKLNVKY